MPPRPSSRTSRYPASSEPICGWSVIGTPGRGQSYSARKGGSPPAKTSLDSEPVDASHSSAHDLVHVLQGSAFMLSDPAGDIHDGSIAGLFHEDTRFLNRFVL